MRTGCLVGPHVGDDPSHSPLTLNALHSQGPLLLLRLAVSADFGPNGIDARFIGLDEIDLFDLDRSPCCWQASQNPCPLDA